MRDIEHNMYTAAPLASPCISHEKRIQQLSSPSHHHYYVVGPSSSIRTSPTISNNRRGGSKRNPLLSAFQRTDSIFSMAIMTCLALILITYLQIERLEDHQQSSSIFNNKVTSSSSSSSLQHQIISKPKSVIFDHSSSLFIASSESSSSSLMGGQISLPLLSLQPLKDDGEKDYGNLDISFFQHDNNHNNDDDEVHNNYQRQIYKNYLLERSEYRSPYEDNNTDDDDDEDVDDDYVAPYYAFDDDAFKGGQTEKDCPCRRISEHRLNFQTCNTFHEQHLLKEGIKFLGEGAFREVFGLEQYSYRKKLEKFVLKELRFDEEVDEQNYEFIRMDASVAERLSASPRTFDIYGYCGVGILSEFFLHGDIEQVAYNGEEEEEDDDDDDDDHDHKQSEDLRQTDELLVVQNDLSGREKLVLALEMAEGIALLHGFRGGVIVHDDIQLSQFLLNEEKTMLKINDFNRAEYMLYDDCKQVYCKYYNGEGSGIWRSPEEYKDEALNEKIDVWSLGNNMYTVLTGLDPFQLSDSEEMKSLVKAGETPYIDPRFWIRSKEEAKLAGIIKKCFEYNPNTRSSVFEIVAELRTAVAASLLLGNNNNITRAQVLQSLGGE